MPPEYIDLLYRFLFFFSLFVIAGLGAPFPEEVLIVGAGIWTSQETYFLLLRWLMLPICIAGVLIADILLYGIGHRYGSKLLRWRWTARLFPRTKVERIERNFHRYGVSILIFGRLLPGIRSPLFLTAGMMRLPFTKFLLADGIGAVLGNSVLFFLAFWFGAQFQELVDAAEGWVNHIKPLIILVSIGGAGLFLLYKFLRTPMPTGDPEELPLFGKQVAARIDSGEIRVIKKPEESANNGQPPKDGTAARVEEMERQ